MRNGNSKSNRFRRFFALMLCCFMMLSLSSSYLYMMKSYAESANTTANIELDLLVDGKSSPDKTTNDTEEGKDIPVYTYYSGQGINATAVLSVSGTDVDYHYAYLKIWMPKSDSEDTQYVKKVSFIDSIAATSTEKSGDNDPEEFSVKYNFKRLQGGFHGEYPLGFKFENLITPNGSTQPLYVGLFDNEGQLIFKKKIKVVFEAKADTNYTINKTITDLRKYHGFFREVRRNSGISSQTPENPTETEVVFHHKFEADPPAGASKGEGEYRAKRFKIRDRIPEGAFFDEEKNTNWHQAEDDPNVYETIINGNEGGETVGASIRLSFPNQPYSENDGTKTRLFENVSEFFVDKGHGFESLGESSASTDFSIIPTSGSTFSVDKRIEDPLNERTDNLMIINGDDERDYRLFKNTANGYVPAFPREKAETEPIWTWKSTFSSYSVENASQTVFRIHDKLEPPEPKGNGNYLLDGTYPENLTQTRFYYKSLRFFVRSNINSSDPDSANMRSNVDDVLNKRVSIYKIRPLASDKDLYRFKRGEYDATSKTLVKTLTVREGLNGVEINDASGEFIGLSIEFDGGLELQNVDFGYDADYSPVEEGFVSEGLDYDGVWKSYRAGRERDFFARLSEYVNLNKDNIGELKKIRAKVGHYVAYTTSENGTIRDERPFTNNSIVFRPKFSYFDINNSTLSPDFLQYQGSENLIRGSLEGVFKLEYGDDPEMFYAKNLRGIILLPPGVTYKRTISTVGTVREPVVVDNFMSTGRQAVVYSFGDYKASNPKPFVSYELSAGKDTPEGYSEVENWFVWDNPVELRAFQSASGNDNSVLDTYNLDGIVRRTPDRYVRQTRNFKFILPGEVVIHQRVSADGETWTNQASLLDQGESFKYKLSVLNLQKTELNNLILLDGLPHKGDLKLVENEYGDYAHRGNTGEGSLFKVSLKGPIRDLPENARANGFFRYEYTKAPLKSNNYIVRSDDWIREEDTANWSEADWEQVTGFRAILTKSLPGKSVEEEELPTNERRNYLEILVPAKSPNDTNLRSFETAFNGVAFTIQQNTDDDNLQYNEANETMVSTVRYSVGGTMFKDVPKNGMIKEGNRLEGYKVSLVYAEDVQDPQDESRILHHAGDVVVENGKELTTFTDSHGVYNMDVFKRGRYKIRFNLKAVQEGFTDRNHTDEYDEMTNMSNVDESTIVSPAITSSTADSATTGAIESGDLTYYAYSSPFSLSPYSMKYHDNGAVDETAPSLRRIRNAGIVDRQLDIKFKKIGVNRALGETREMGSPLSGAEFVLKKLDESYVPTGENYRFASDDKGEFLLKNLPFGKYRFVENNTQVGYSTFEPVIFVLDELGVHFENPDGGNWNYDKLGDVFEYDKNSNSLEIVNFSDRASLKVIKRDSESGSPLSGAEFYLLRDGKEPVFSYDDNGERSIYTVTSDENGEAIFRNLPKGSYVIKERKAPDGFAPFENGVDLQNDGREVAVSRSDSENGDVTNVITIQNRPFSGKISVVKTDFEKEDRLLAGAEFSLFKKSDFDRDGRNAQAVSKVRTGTNGRADFTNLNHGKYVVVESQPPKGYDLSTEEFTVNVAIDAAMRTYRVDFADNALYGDVVVQKSDKDSGKKLGNAVFELQMEDESGRYVSLLGEDGDPMRATTDSNGVARFSHIRMGRYKIIEITAPKGYKQDQKGKEFVLSGDDRMSESEMESTAVNFQDDEISRYVSYQNEKLDADIAFRKVDSETGKPLEGAVFEIEYLDDDLSRIDSDDAADLDEEANDGISEEENSAEESETDSSESLKPTSKRAISDENGLVKFDKIPYGKYRIREIKPPKNYKIDRKEVTVVVDGTKDIIDIGDWTNAPIKNVLIITKKDKDTGEALSDVEFILKNEGGEVARLKTDENGIAQFENLNLGDYLLEENPLEGYKGIEPMNITIEEGDPIEISISNEKLETVKPPLKGKTPFTGDDTMTEQWVMIFIASALCLVIILLLLKKRSSKE